MELLEFHWTIFRLYECPFTQRWDFPLFFWGGGHSHSFAVCGITALSQLCAVPFHSRKVHVANQLFFCDGCSRNVQTPWISPPMSLNMLTPRLAFCQTPGVVQGVTSCSSIFCFELWVLCGAGIPVFRYMSPGFRARKSSWGISYYLEVILLNVPGRNQPADIPAGRSIHWGDKMMFKSILLPACDKFTNMCCQAVLGGCWKHVLSGTAWHQLHGCLQTVSQVVVWGFPPTAHYFKTFACVWCLL